MAGTRSRLISSIRPACKELSAGGGSAAEASVSDSEFAELRQEHREVDLVFADEQACIYDSSDASSTPTPQVIEL